MKKLKNYEEKILVIIKPLLRSLKKLAKSLDRGVVRLLSTNALYIPLSLNQASINDTYNETITKLQKYDKKNFSLYNKSTVAPVRMRIYIKLKKIVIKPLRRIVDTLKRRQL